MTSQSDTGLQKYESLAELMSSLAPNLRKIFEGITFDYDTLTADTIEFSKRLQALAMEDALKSLTEEEREQVPAVISELCRLRALASIAKGNDLCKLYYFDFINRSGLNGTDTHELKSECIGEVVSDTGLFIVSHRRQRQVKECRLKIRIVDDSRGETSKMVDLVWGDILIDAILYTVIKIYDPITGSTKYKTTWIRSNGHREEFDLLAADQLAKKLIEKGLVVRDERNIHQNLRSVLRAHEEFGKTVYKVEIEQRGFFWLDGKMVASHVEIVDRAPEQVLEGLDFIEQLYPKIRRKERLPTALKWTAVAPFAYIRKQRGISQTKGWFPYLVLDGRSQTGKSYGIGWDIVLGFWGLNAKEHQELHFISFGSARNEANFTKVIGLTSFPVVINEADALSDISQHDIRKLISIMKNAVENVDPRTTLSKDRQQIPAHAMSPCMITSNDPPPEDLPWLNRIIRDHFTQADDVTEEDRVAYKKFIAQNGHKIRFLGDFTAKYVMQHPECLNKAWNDTAMEIFQAMYAYAGREMPSWMGALVENHQTSDENEKQSQQLRRFMIDKVNDTYTKFRRMAPTLWQESEEGAIPALVGRILACIDNRWLPWLHRKEKKVYFTYGITEELEKNGIKRIKLTEIAETIPGFKYKTERLGKETAKVAIGTLDDLYLFLESNAVLAEDASGTSDIKDGKVAQVRKLDFETCKTCSIYCYPNRFKKCTAHLTSSEREYLGKERILAGIADDLAKTSEQGTFKIAELMEQCMASKKFATETEILEILGNLAASGRYQSVVEGTYAMVETARGG